MRTTFDKGYISCSCSCGWSFSVPDSPWTPFDVWEKYRMHWKMAHEGKNPYA